MDDIIQEATEAYEQGRDAGYAVGELLRIIKNQTVEIDILIRKKKTLRDEIAEKDAHIAGLQKVNAEMFDTIGEKYAEIERLRSELRVSSEALFNAYATGNKIKSEAYTEFAERLKVKKAIYYCKCGRDINTTGIINLNIDNLLKKMTENN